MTDYLASKTILLCLDCLGEIKRDYIKTLAELEDDLGEKLKVRPYGHLIDGYIAMLEYWRAAESTAPLTEQSAILRVVADAIGLVPYLRARLATIARDEPMLTNRQATVALLHQVIKAVSDE